MSEGLLFCKKAKVCLKEGNFHRREFESNSKELSNLIKEDNSSPSEINKVLSLKWGKTEDNFIFSFKDLICLIDNKHTKRNILRCIATFYDPLGLESTTIVRCKILYQPVCKLKVEWNSLIGGNILNEWNEIFDDLGSVPFVRVPRWLVCL